MPGRNMRKLLIRADAGGNLGFGHVSRCLSLAESVRAHYGIWIVFYSNPYAKLEEIYRKHGFEYVSNEDLSEAELLRKMGNDAPGSTILIDVQFPYGRDDIRSLGTGVKTVMLGNLCDGMRECDYVIFPSAHLGDQEILDLRKYDNRSKFLHGLDYVIINQSIMTFLDRREDSIPRPHIAITTGASDPEGILIRVLRWMNESDLDIPVKALYGFDFCHKAELASMLPKLRPNIEVKRFNYDDLFSSRLALSAFGVVTYELIYAGIPVITVGHATPNDLGGKALQGRYRCNHHLGLFREVSREQLVSCVRDLWGQEEGLAVMRRNQAGLIDGGGLERIGRIIYSCCSGEQL